MPRMIETTRPFAHALPSLARLFTGAAKAFGTWQARRVSRRALSLLDPHMLRDVGLTMQSRADETAKPFWRD
jgi:uncharacterized protein YjiS (DUF1127 family)